MSANYFKVIWRSLLRERQFTLLNLIGLSTGLACALLIWLWVNNERSIDHFNKHDERLYQVIKTSVNGDGTIDTHETTPALMAQSMAADFPEVEYAVPVVIESENGIIGTPDKKVKTKARFAGKDFFRIFSYPILDGNSNDVLSDPMGVMLSDQLALKLFNTTTGLTGKVLIWNGEPEISGPYHITGVFKAPAADATDQFDLLFSFDHYYSTFWKQYGLDVWYSNNPSTYLLLRKGTNVTAFNDKIKDYSRKKLIATNAKDAVPYEGDMFVQRYSEKYLHNLYDNGKIAGGRIQYVRLFSIIAVFIIVIACINFMNLATARANAKMKEVSIRKIIGARRGSLILQYIAEATFMALLSLCVAILIVWLLLPEFRNITGKDLHFDFSAYTILSIIAIALISGLLAGSYPAIYLSGFRPAAVLKNSSDPAGGQALIRKGLVVFQFAVSVVFIVAVMVVYRQMDLVQKKNLGFSKDNVIYFSAEGNVFNDFKIFLNELKKIPGVVNASGMDGDLVGNHSGGGGISWAGQATGQGIEFDGLDVNYDWVETFGMQLKEGRTFSRKYGGDSSSVLFNETAIKAMRLNDPVGKKVTMFGKEKTIVGVLKDFNYESLYRKPGPFFVRFEPKNTSVVVKIKNGTMEQTLARVKDVYQSFNKGLAFEYKFIDDDFAKLYASERRVAVLSKYFAGLAIIISCLGLFGLSAFTAQKRQKEIGIRKVIGAAAHDIAFMLSKDFLKLVLLALTIALPVAWWLMNSWLNAFEYRITVGADIFALAIFATIIVTIATISFQSVKASLANPVKSLRTE
jgi:ABC-type antimicrobial peptide transport system permease subunit